jgi:hypothetical protein
MSSLISNPPGSVPSEDLSINFALQQLVQCWTTVVQECDVKCGRGEGETVFLPTRNIWTAAGLFFPLKGQRSRLVCNQGHQPIEYDLNHIREVVSVFSNHQLKRYRYDFVKFFQKR